MRRRASVIIVITAAIVCLLGLAIGVLGGWLVTLGGSPYYLIAGILLLVTGVLLFRNNRAAPWVYAFVLIGTFIWALMESGLDGWALIPRLIGPAVIGLWIWSPLVYGRLYCDPASSRSRLPRSLTGMAVNAAIIAFVFATGYWITDARFIRNGDPSGWQNVSASASNGQVDPTTPDEAWNFYGRTPAGDRFSPLTQITADNVKNMKPAWSFSTGDLPRSGENSNGREFSFEATPIKIGDTLYFCTPHREVVALGATDGKVKWRFDPAGDMSHNVYQACRGVSYYDASQAIDTSATCKTRIISTASDLPRLFELDAETGKPCEGFGSQGMVDLREHMGPVPPGFHFISSPPLVLNGKIVLGGWVYDNQTVGEPSGVIRAFDANTGALVWSWDMGKTPANKKLDPKETYTRGTPNGWGVYTADPKLNLVFVPLGNATPDYFGGERRPFDDKYSSSIVALDLTTGEERWHFQTVHHDLWDFDLPAGPSLVDLPDGKGGITPALVQTSKQGQLFLLDRRDGHPLADVEEKLVPQGHIPGERYSPTQPFSTGMPQTLAPKLQEADMWGATPIDQLLCRIAFHRMRDDGLFTPPGEKPTIGWPAFDGTSDWYGATVDPERKLLYINTTFMPFQLQMVPYEAALKAGLFKPWGGWSQPYPQPEFQNNPEHGTPFSIVVKPWFGIFGIPCNRPPWGQMQAVDLLTKKVVWQRPIGTTRDMGPSGLRAPFGLPTGIFSMGGSVATRSGLVFMGATTDQTLRAFDGSTGEVLWETHLPAGGNATPLTYMGSDRRQYVVIAAGGHGGLQSRNGDYVMAFAIPKS
ncbi:membrane-bound PQQ-dependent dehydrogenase, glucose/quinate/shikimate family [Rhizobium sp. B230/85]|uniref:membrane-bound PQQ-dependent dehydrogenase, glucose/quinate/shikimate family n=1 Tax=unclassified Rhizobium TaxID=2613769 RepID=UPI001ADBAC5B|nr:MULTISPECIES: membrane-bound PQQ-dependent dehydrogenase, glucose/quinate/shikimate family [unclassified Rhizobium]MBO9136939.1 membrane-bound PQQ-dependent dehydrogenase, glucose/quinate/shikimate family [Rhizobium sp. B209b/85]QXZ98559.1 membrane-bound PQQ-dependent dehydrogenase, glucose/quinate/shikimate family [Rhizobium sp. B230/85]